MKISLLMAHGIRNLAPVQLEPRERFNVFVGHNGQGKTNLLEAIYVVATLRSFRTSRLADLIAFDRQDAQLGARVEREGMSRIYQVELSPGTRRVLLDSKAVRPIARYFGGFNVVVFTPEDLGLPRGAPSDRRKFLDRAVFNQGTDYLVAMQDFEKVLKQRNTVLKQAAQGMAQARVDDLLDVYDHQLAPLAATVANTRAAFVEKIRKPLQSAFASISRSDHHANVKYISKTAGLSVEAIAAHLRETHARDLATESTQSGPHRDDLAFELDERAAGDFASQGQLRAIMLAWKTAELELLAHTHAEQPILLLDDVSSELDPARNAYLFEHLANQAGQCFITTTSEHHVLLSRERADYRIENGQISS
jgi:DNA replication and repair protein RecF